MDIFRILLSLLYPIIFIIPITLSGLCYMQTMRRECLIAGLLFFVFIIDHLVILLTELVPNFAERYDSIFLTVPTWKTMIYVVSIGCMIYLFEYNMKVGKIFLEAIVLFIFTFFQMFVPMLPDGALKVWIYYFPPQLYMFIFSISALIYMKRHSEKFESEDKTMKYIRMIVIFTLIFSVAIVAEDTFVIFNVDNYSIGSTYIYNRNNCEDVFRVLLAVYSSLIMLNLLKESNANDTGTEFLEAAAEEVTPMSEPVSGLAETDSPDGSENDTTAAVQEEKQTADDRTNADFIKFMTFSESYQLTERERRIFSLMLQNKSNQEISDEFTISLGTVKTHTHNIFSKLDVSRRSEAISLYENFEGRAAN